MWNVDFVNDPRNMQPGDFEECQELLLVPFAAAAHKEHLEIDKRAAVTLVVQDVGDHTIHDGEVCCPGSMASRQRFRIEIASTRTPSVTCRTVNSKHSISTAKRGTRRGYKQPGLKMSKRFSSATSSLTVLGHVS